MQFNREISQGLKAMLIWRQLSTFDVNLSMMGKSQIKSNQITMSTKWQQFYARNVINVHMAWLSNVSVKIRDSTITEINSLTQLQ